MGLIHTAIRIMLTYLWDGAAIEDLVAILMKDHILQIPPKVWSNILAWVVQETTTDLVPSTTALISHRSRNSDISDQGTSRSRVYWGPSSWFTDSPLGFISSHCRQQRQVISLMSLLKRALTHFKKAPSSWLDYFPKAHFKSYLIGDSDLTQLFQGTWRFRP